MGFWGWGWQDAFKWFPLCKSSVSCTNERNWAPAVQDDEYKWLVHSPVLL